MRYNRITITKGKAKSITLLIALTLATLLFVTNVNAAPKSELWAIWNGYDGASQKSVNHSAWNDITKKYIVESKDGINRFRYGKVSSADKTKLQGYLGQLQSVDVLTLNRDEQRAYWINLYNALTVKVILDHYPTESILDIDISPGIFSNGPWGKKLVTINATEVSLDDIEHRILRPIWKDARIHYAVNCASIGCPNLQNQAFTASNTEQLLNAGAKAYVNHSRGVNIDNGELVVSSIYKWFKEDFGGNDKGVIAHLRQYANAKLKQSLIDYSSIDGDEYDWDLNIIN